MLQWPSAVEKTLPRLLIIHDFHFIKNHLLNFIAANNQELGCRCYSFTVKTSIDTFTQLLSYLICAVWS